MAFLLPNLSPALLLQTNLKQKANHHTLGHIRPNCSMSHLTQLASVETPTLLEDAKVKTSPGKQDKQERDDFCVYLGLAVRTLREDMPLIFAEDLNYDIYRYVVGEELREAISSILFSAPRCSEVPDLLQIKNLFTAKYGKEFIAAATELRPDSGVNRTIIEKFSISAPSGEERLKVLKAISQEYNLNWDSFSTEAEFSKKYEDLLMSMDAKSFTSRLVDAGLLRSQALIGGKWSDAYDGKTMEVTNPATGDVITTVPCMGQNETNDAISAAHNAFSSWSKVTSAERSKYLRKWYDLLVSHKEELGKLITLEQGKPLQEAMGEVTYGASFVEFFAEEAKRIYGDIIPAPLSDRRLLVLKQPVGVVGAITPWNFPLAMITRKVGPALACGCTVVIKPSELTPLTALAAAELALRAGIPPGVVNVVMGNASAIGDALLASPQVRKITFTGSTAVGKKLMAGAANTVKKVSLELGGNAPCIVFDDADLDVAVKGAIGAKFSNSGQTCVCANRILVQEGIYDKFVDAFAKAVQKLQVGQGFTEGVSQGPLINEAAVQKVESFVKDATSKGAKVVLGAKRHSLGMTFYEPTVLRDVKSDMIIAREEVFGPVAPVLSFKTEDDAIKMANDTSAGLAAYMFTSNVQRSWCVAEALEYGLVGVNEGLISTEVAPFGGVKQSGLGREGSKYGMDEYLEIKYVCLGNMNSK